MARRQDDLFGDGKPKADMSPMIDLVFLILIFFMIASTAITYKKDPNVEIPIAFDGKVPEAIEGRVIINVYKDGSAYDENSKPLSIGEVETLMSRIKQKNPNARLHLRADKGVKHQKVKEVIQASARGGVSQVIFSTYVTDK